MKNKPVTCKEVFNHICENLDEKIDSPQCREIRRHLDRCPSCVAYLDSLKKTIRLYRAYPPPRLPQKARKKLHAQLKAQLSSIGQVK
jgi:RNA polymerase sigma-70 factor (ECF subfamily)